MEGWASEVVTEDDDFILEGLVWNRDEVREGRCPPLSWSRGYTVFPLGQEKSSTLLRGGFPKLMVYLGKVVLFFSQGLRTDSG